MSDIIYWYGDSPGRCKTINHLRFFETKDHQEEVMETMEKISFETPKTFVPTETQFDILRAVADKQGCHISHVVHALHPTRSENNVRSGVRVLLSRGCLDGGKSSSEVLLRLTSRGRLLLQPSGIPPVASSSPAVSD